MRTLMLAMALLLARGAGAAPPSAESFAEVVREIRAADYAGARAELRRLADLLDGGGDPALAAYRHY